MGWMESPASWRGSCWGSLSKRLLRSLPGARGCAPHLAGAMVAETVLGWGHGSGKGGLGLTCL